MSQDSSRSQPFMGGSDQSGAKQGQTVVLSRAAAEYAERFITATLQGTRFGPSHHLLEIRAALSQSVQEQGR